MPLTGAQATKGFSQRLPNYSHDNICVRIIKCLIRDPGILLPVHHLSNSRLGVDSCSLENATSKVPHVDNCIGGIDHDWVLRVHMVYRHVK